MDPRREKTVGVEAERGIAGREDGGGLGLTEGPRGEKTVIEWATARNQFAILFGDRFKIND